MGYKLCCKRIMQINWNPENDQIQQKGRSQGVKLPVEGLPVLEKERTDVWKSHGNTRSD